MEYTRLGSTGLKISRLALGTTFWDSAKVYSAGSSEEIVGRAIREYSRRENVVLATKVHHLDDAVAALDLTDAEVTALEEHYTPRWPAGF